ncbi:asparaginase [Haloferacaceae archaeon DSL9]
MSASEIPAEPTVCVASCGGTIASEPDERGAAPTKTGSELVEAVPELTEYAQITVAEVVNQPGFGMNFEDVLAAATAVRDAAEDADGVVLTQGTDTLADTAYMLDLLTDVDAPVVVTGAQRRFDEPSSDAPANLLTAVRAAADPIFSPGTYVAFDEELHAGRDAVKTHTSALDTFQSPGKGPVATFTRGGVHLVREPKRRSASLPLASVAEPIPPVAVVHSGTGVDGRPVERALDDDVAGIVLEGTGLGNVTAALGEAVESAVESVPVVVSSRCHAGPTEPVYGTPGGGVSLERYGAMFAGDLSTSKARVTLALGLAAGLDDSALRALFESA